MKIKKLCFSTMVSDLWGRDGYQSHIELGREYWYYFAENTDTYRITNKHWNKLKITYIRSGCLFYIIPEYPEIKEDFCPVSCFMSTQFILAEIDPIKDMGVNMLGNIDAAKIKYCFNDEHTVVKNWPNEKESEINDDELYNKFSNSAEFIFIKALEKRDT